MMSSRSVRKKNKVVQLKVLEVNIERCSDWAAVLVAESYMCDWEGSAGGRAGQDISIIQESR